MIIPAYKIGDEVTYRRKSGGQEGSGIITSAFCTANNGPHYWLEGLVATITEDEILCKTVSLVEENTKLTPAYLHITKKSLKQTNSRSYPYNYNSDWTPRHGPYAQQPSRDLWDSTVLGPSVPKKYKIPVHYMVTTYIHVTAETLSEAIQQAQHIEPPQIEVWDNTAHDTTIESEVCPYDIEEIEN